jgi:drug/metabolite transporter (DMT)-like permease
LKKWLAFGVLVTIHGSGFMFVDIAVRQVTPLELTLLRFVIGAPALLLVIYLRRLPVSLDWKFLRGVILIGILNNTIPFLLIASAQQQGLDSGLAGVLIATNPLFTLVIAHFVFADERMNLTKALGVIAGFGGAVILATRNWQDGQLVTEGLLGMGAVILSAFFFAVSGAISRRMMQGHPRNPMVIAAGTLTVAMIASTFLVLMHILRGNPITPPASLHAETIAAVLVLGFVQTFTAFMMMFYIIRELGVTRASMGAYIIPIISLTMGTVFLNEVIDTRVILGTTVILSGIAVVNIGTNISRRRAMATGIEPSLSGPRV